MEKMIPEGSLWVVSLGVVPSLLAFCSGSCWGGAIEGLSVGYEGVDKGEERKSRHEAVRRRCGGRARERGRNRHERDVLIGVPSHREVIRQVTRGAAGERGYIRNAECGEYIHVMRAT
jgi:hypothetical protein